LSIFPEQEFREFLEFSCFRRTSLSVELTGYKNTPYESPETPVPESGNVPQHPLVAPLFRKIQGVTEIIISY
jgi:hypothetical protein